MDTHHSSASILSAGSTATLDLVDLLSSCPSENLLSTGLDFPALDSSHSFDNIPPFPTSAKPLIFIPDIGTSLLCSPSPSASPTSDATPALTTVPTGPRLRVMMLESLSIGVWTESVLPESGPPCGLDEDVADLNAAEPSSWIPAGSLFSPQGFASLFRKGLSSLADGPSFALDDRDSNPDLTLVDTNVSTMSSLASLSEAASSESSYTADNVHQQPMPTIMVSNSTAVLPLSLGSSHDLQSELPLAVRRGKKLPPALSLGQSKMERPHGSADDDYANIPTPFLGSPTTSTPITQQPLEPSTFTMGLSSMCADLRSRLPSPPPFSPTEPVPPRPESRLGCTLPWQDSFASDLDDDEWAFARDLVADWHSSRKPYVVSPPPSPAVELPYTSSAASPIVETYYEAVPPSLESGSESSSDEEDVVQTPATLKQTRRKTVIIQAPESGSLVRPAQTEKVLSIAADGGTDPLIHAFDDPVPFETPSRFSGHLSCELTTHTPPGSRPTSTASTRPVRGILKEKKSVRFSTVDMFHEYTTPNHSPARDIAEGVVVTPQCSAPVPPQTTSAARDRRLTLTATVHRSSPLRESFAPTPLAAAKGPDGRARIHSPAARQLQEPSLFTGRTTAKHPAVRALARAPSVAGPQPPYSARPASAGPPSAPQPQSPAPVLLDEQRRAPLRSINARQTMPVERRPDALIPVKPTRGSMLPTGRGGVPATLARRVLRSTSIPPRPRHEQDENARRRSQPAAAGPGEASCGPAAGAAGHGGRSRMSAPLRSIFTKLRT